MTDHVEMMREIVENQEMLTFLIVLMLSLAVEGIVVIVMMFVIRRVAYDMFRGYNQTLRGITKWIDLHEKLKSDPNNKTEKDAAQ